MLANMHQNRACLKPLSCTKTVHVRSAEHARLGVQHRPVSTCTAAVQPNMHGFGAPLDNPPTYVGTGQPNPSCTCMQDGPNTLPQPDYVVRQVGDCVVTKRPRTRDQVDACNERCPENRGFPENGGFP
jgi:hypothetical protein